MRQTTVSIHYGYNAVLRDYNQHFNIAIERSNTPHKPAIGLAFFMPSRRRLINGRRNTEYRPKG